jgi:outer membrane protein OmpA-like peptidoglycan-associated protein
VKVVPDTTTLLPDMPGGPPALPVLSGVSLPQSVAPGVYPVAPAKPAAAVAPPTPGAPVPIAFTPGSAVVPADYKAALAALAANRGASAIVAIGYGDAVSSEAQAQADALPLALARARSIAIGLTALGVPPSAVVISAESQGAGGIARLATN